MDFIKLKIPCSLNLNTVKAYINPKSVKRTRNKTLNSLDLEKFLEVPKSLRILILDYIVENWENNPIFYELPKQADRNYLLDNIDVNIPIKILSTYIRDNVFWRRCFKSKWKNCSLDNKNKKWISIYMERYLSEILEKMEPAEYDQENVQIILDICSPYVERLEVNYLQPSMTENPGHIPFDYILAGLPELRYFRITFCTKTIGTQYYIGCSIPTKIDILFLCRGIQKCYELIEFCFHRTKLEPYVLQNLARSLDKGCSNLEVLELSHCRFGDGGVSKFINELNSDSFPMLRKLILTNNLFSQESALILSRAITFKTKLEYLDVSLNPIGSDGAAAIFSALNNLPIRTLLISACSITNTITRLLLKLLIESKTLFNIDTANNDLGKDVGDHIYQIIGFNKILKNLDLRNTGTPIETRNKINSVLLKNRDTL